MSISSISSSASSAVSSIPQSSQVMRKEKENDGDTDDGSSKMNAAKPTVNTSGQVIGANINVTA
ncbi:MAG TPA: hypothetical protein VFW53_06970 [Gallionella sp.]|nr:hypothetical protein [Gallionella sp.]